MKLIGLVPLAMLVAGTASAATNSGNSVVFIPGVQSGPCSTWPSCPAVPNDTTHPFYFAPSTGATFAVTGTFWQGTQPVSAVALPLPSNAAQETGGNLAAISSSTSSTATSAATTATNTGSTATNTSTTAANTTAISGATGTTADVAYSGSGTSTIVAALKGIYAKLAGVLSFSPAQTTPAGPDISSVTTGGTAVNAFSAGHCAKGCFVRNPATATQNLCANGVTTASGTSDNAATLCAGPGQQVTFTPRATAISVVSSDAPHTFAGEGYQ
jgi:hypothetical protein